MELQELQDRMEIPAVLTRYASGLDIEGRDFAQWDHAFVPDAVFVNWDGPGSERGRAEMERFLAADDPVHSHQHLLTNIVIVELGADVARTRAEYLHVGVHRTGSSEEARWIFKGGYYEDDLVRTPEGWRIARHVIHRRWDKYEIVPWPPAGTTWARTEMAPRGDA
jgi:3-phenylpropionate/cinnamic acid dioxygenase small subunit